MKQNLWHYVKGLYLSILFCIVHYCVRSIYRNLKEYVLGFQGSILRKCDLKVKFVHFCAWIFFPKILFHLPYFYGCCRLYFFIVESIRNSHERYPDSLFYYIINVFIENGTKEIFFDRYINTTTKSELILKNATIYWNYKNVRSGVNDNWGHGYFSL